MRSNGLLGFKTFIYVTFTLFCLLSITAVAEDIIVVLGTSQKSMNKADIVMATGTEQGLNFVERAQINKILAEQKLSLKGLVRADSIIKVGKLLRADIIAQIIDDSNTKLGNRVIIFDTKNGIRLEDRFLPNKGFDLDVAEILVSLNNSIIKYNSLKLNQVKFISFLPINLLSTDKQSIKSATLAQLFLKQRLLLLKKHLLLERDLVDLLLQEKIITNTTLDKLKSCSFTIAVEAKIVDSKRKKLLLSAYLKDSKGKIRDEVEQTYTVGQERQAVAEMIKSFVKVINAEDWSKKTDSKVEAKVFLKDSKRALRNHDHSKSMLSLKNAYLLDPELKSEINEIILFNIKAIGGAIITMGHVSKLLPGEERNLQKMLAKDKLAQYEKSSLKRLKRRKAKYDKTLKSAKLFLSLLNYYRKINGHAMKTSIRVSFKRNKNRLSAAGSKRIFLHCFQFKELRSKIRKYHHDYMIENLSELKQKYNYKNKTKGSKEYFAVYTNYLIKLQPLVDVGWTSQYWLIYMAPELINYIKEVSVLDEIKRRKIKYLSTSNIYFPVRDFYDSNRAFSAKIFNTVISINQLLFNAPIVRWRIFAKYKLYWIKKYATYAGKNRRPHRVKLGRLKECNLKFNDKFNYEFIKYVGIQAIGINYNDLGIYRAYFDWFLSRYIYRNNKLNTELFGIAMQSDLANVAIRRFITNLHGRDSAKLNSRKTLLPELNELQKIAIQHGAKDAEKSINREIVWQTAKQDRLKTIAHKVQGSKYFQTDKKILSSRNASITGVVQEGNFTYSLIAKRSSFFLLKTNVKNKFETVAGQVLRINESRTIGGSTPISLVGSKYIIQFNGSNGILLYPKNGDLPEFIKYERLVSRKVVAACYVNKKVYFFTMSSTVSNKTRPFEIIELNLRTKSFKVMFAANQEKNNPFKKNIKRLHIEREVAFNKSTNDLVIPLSYYASYKRKGFCWKFNIVSGKWKTLYTQTSRITNQYQMGSIGNNLLIGKCRNVFKITVIP